MHLRRPDAIPELRAAARSLWGSNGEEFQRQYEFIRQPDDPPTFDDRIAKIDPLVPVKVEVNAIIKLIDNNKVCGLTLFAAPQAGFGFHLIPTPSPPFSRVIGRSASLGKKPSS